MERNRIGHPGGTGRHVDAGERAVELCVTEGEDAAVRTDDPVATTVGGADDGGHRVGGVPTQHAGQRPIERGVSEGKDATIGPEEPVSLAVRSRSDPHDVVDVDAHPRSWSRWNRAFPKEKTPPSRPTNQYPPPSGVGAMATEAR